MKEETKKTIKDWLLLIGVGIVLILSLVCCRTTQVIGGNSHSKDSVRIEHKVDTFTQFVHDSIRIQLPCSDTIEVAYVERWHTNTITKKTEIHDTIAVNVVDTIPVPVEVVREVQKKGFLYNSGIALWVILGLLLAGIIIGLILKFSK